MDFDLLDSIDNGETLVYPNNIDMTALWLSHIIRVRRKDLGLTQGRISSVLGLGMSAISSIEAGNAFANIKRTIQVMNLLHLPLAPILSAIESQAVIHNSYPLSDILFSDEISHAWRNLEVFEATDPPRLVVLDKHSGKTRQVLLPSKPDRENPADQAAE